MSASKGYTLIEVLVASAIFVGVMVIGISSFSSVNRVNEQIETTRKLSQTGNFVMETLAREIRTATGIKGKITSTGKPFVLASSSSISITTCPDEPGGDCAAPDVHSYAYTASTHRFTKVVGATSSGTSILPADVTMTDFKLAGSGFSTTTTVQPFVTISFTLQACTDQAGQTGCSQQAFRTSVTSLVYPR